MMKREPFLNVMQHKQLLVLFIFFSASFLIILNRFYKEGLLDPDDSAAGDFRDHLHLSLLVRHHNMRFPSEMS